MDEPQSLDGFLPPQIAKNAEDIGVMKGNLPILQLFLLGGLAGAFIALACVFYTTVITGNGLDGSIKLPFGVIKLLGGMAFSLGLILVVVAGAELFTGNNLMVMAVASKKLPLSRLLRNWGVVYVGNLIGSVVTAYLMYLTAQYTFADGAFGVKAMAIADTKCGLDLVPAVTRAIFCNVLVCLAVWLCMSCRTTTDRVMAIVFPITAFVAAGFEHCVANMYLVPVALFIRGDVAYWVSQGVDPASFANLSWSAFVFRNLIPVTIGNVIGGAVFVGVAYWLIYNYPAARKAEKAAQAQAQAQARNPKQQPTPKNSMGETASVGETLT